MNMEYRTDKFIQINRVYLSFAVMKKLHDYKANRKEQSSFCCICGKW